MPSRIPAEIIIIYVIIVFLPLFPKSRFVCREHLSPAISLSRFSMDENGVLEVKLD